MDKFRIIIIITCFIVTIIIGSYFKEKLGTKGLLLYWIGVSSFAFQIVIKQILL